MKSTKKARAQKPSLNGDTNTVHVHLVTSPGLGKTGLNVARVAAFKPVTWLLQRQREIKQHPNMVEDDVQRLYKDCTKTMNHLYELSRLVSLADRSALDLLTKLKSTPNSTPLSVVMCRLIRTWTWSFGRKSTTPQEKEEHESNLLQSRQASS